MTTAVMSNFKNRGLFLSENPKASDYFFKTEVFRRHHVLNDPINFTDPAGKSALGNIIPPLLTPGTPGEIIGGSCGSAIGGAIGGSVGGPPGAVLGGLIGGQIGSAIGGQFGNGPGQNGSAFFGPNPGFNLPGPPLPPLPPALPPGYELLKSLININSETFAFASVCPYGRKARSSISSIAKSRR